MKLKTSIKKNGNCGFDIADGVFDYVVYFDYSKEDMDDYDKVMELIASKINVIEYRQNWFTICDITGFIAKNRSIFDDFMEAVYKTEYTPEYLCRKYNLKQIDKDTELFCSIYIELLFNDIVIGNLSDSDYKILYEMLLNEGVK